MLRAMQVTNATRLQTMTATAVQALLGSIVVLFASCSEQRHARYNSFASLQGSGQGARSWFPECLPDSAFDLEEVHDLDSNQVVGHFQVPISDIASVQRCGQHELFQETGLHPLLERWPPCLTGDVSSYTVQRCGLVSHTEAKFVVVVDPKTGSVWYWSK